MLNDKINNSLLLDYYGDLLTNHQVEILTDYLNEDLSMTEIAQNYSISKSAVQDLIKRSINQLQNYEKVLKLIEKNSKLEVVLNDMKNEKNEIIDSYVKKIERINK